MMQGLTQYFRIVNNTRNNILRENIQAFKQKKLNLGNGAVETKPQIGDLVLIKNTDNEKMGTYGVVRGLEGESSAIINTRKGMVRRATCQLIPLAGSHLVRKTVDQEL